MSRVVDAVEASKSLTRTRSRQLPRARQGDVGDHVILATAERVDDRPQRSHAELGSVSSTAGVSNGSSGAPRRRSGDADLVRSGPRRGDRRAMTVPASSESGTSTAPGGAATSDGAADRGETESGRRGRPSHRRRRAGSPARRRRSCPAARRGGTPALIGGEADDRACASTLRRWGVGAASTVIAAPAGAGCRRPTRSPGSPGPPWSAVPGRSRS